MLAGRDLDPAKEQVDRADLHRLVVEPGAPAGKVEVRHDQLKELVKSGKIDSYEVICREVILYWRFLKPNDKVDLPLTLVAAVPGASILELGDWGIRPARWEELRLVEAWRRFLAEPDSYFRHLLAD